MKTRIDRLLAAVDAVSELEARRLDIPFLDPTYHGCDPRWAELRNAATALRELPPENSRRVLASDLRRAGHELIAMMIETSEVRVLSQSEQCAGETGYTMVPFVTVWAEPFTAAKLESVREVIRDSILATYWDGRGQPQAKLEIREWAAAGTQS